MNAILGPLVNYSKCSGSCTPEPQPIREFASIVKCRVPRKIQVLRSTVLKLYLLIFIDRVFDSRVEDGIPSFAAAATGKRTVWARARGLHRRYHSEDRPTGTAWWPKKNPSGNRRPTSRTSHRRRIDRSRSRGFAARSFGQRHKIIAEKLDISEETVKAHVRRLLSKLHANHRTHAVAIAVKRGTIEI